MPAVGERSRETAFAPRRSRGLKAARARLGLCPTDDDVQRAIDTMARVVDNTLVYLVEVT